MEEIKVVKKSYRKTFALLSIGLILFAVGLLFGMNIKSSQTRNIAVPDKNTVEILKYSRPSNVLGTKIPITQSTTCNFTQVDSTVYKDDEKQIEFTSNKESSPNVVAFSNLDTDVPMMVGNAGQAQLTKIINSDDIVTLIENDTIASDNMIAYTIFKKYGVAIWTKQYQLLSYPYGLLSMGYCQ